MGRETKPLEYMGWLMGGVYLEGTKKTEMGLKPFPHPPSSDARILHAIYLLSSKAWLALVEWLIFNVPLLGQS